MSELDFILRKAAAALQNIEGSVRVETKEADTDVLRRAVGAISKQEDTPGPSGPGIRPTTPVERFLAKKRNELAQSPTGGKTLAMWEGGASGGFGSGSQELQEANARLGAAVTRAYEASTQAGIEAEREAQEGSTAGALMKGLQFLAVPAAFIQGLFRHAAESAVGEVDAGDNPIEDIFGSVKAGLDNAKKAANGEEYDLAGTEFSVFGIKTSTGDLLLDPLNFLFGGIGKGARFARGTSRGTVAFLRGAAELAESGTAQAVGKRGADELAQGVANAFAQASGGQAAKAPKAVVDDLRDMLRFTAKRSTPEDIAEMRRLADHLDEVGGRTARAGDFKSGFRTAERGLLRDMPSTLSPGLKLSIPFTGGRGLKLTTGKSTSGAVQDALGRIPVAREFLDLVDTKLDFWHDLRKKVGDLGFTETQFTKARQTFRRMFSRQNSLEAKAAHATIDLNDALRKAGVEGADAHRHLEHFGRHAAEDADVAVEELYQFLRQNKVSERQARRAAEGFRFHRYELLQAAIDAGINIQELRGHVAHVITAAGRKAVKEFKGLSDESAAKLRKTAPGDRIGTDFQHQRTITGDIEEINAWFREVSGGADLFEEDIAVVYSTYGRSLARAISRNEALEELVEQGLGTELLDDVATFIERSPSPRARKAIDRIKSTKARVGEKTATRKGLEAKAAAARQAAKGAAIGREALHEVRRAQGVVTGQSPAQRAAARSRQKQLANKHLAVEFKDARAKMAKGKERIAYEKQAHNAARKVGLDAETVEQHLLVNDLLAINATRAGVISDPQDWYKARRIGTGDPDKLPPDALLKNMGIKPDNVRGLASRAKQYERVNQWYKKSRRALRKEAGKGRTKLADGTEIRNDELLTQLVAVTSNIGTPKVNLDRAVGVLKAFRQGYDRPFLKGSKYPSAKKFEAGAEAATAWLQRHGGPAWAAMNKSVREILAGDDMRKWTPEYLSRVMGTRKPRAGESMLNYIETAGGGKGTRAKVYNFYQNLKNLKDPDFVTVDRWAIRLFADDFDAENSYRMAATALRKTAKRLGWEPREVQAALWTYVKDRLGDTAGDLDFEDVFAKHPESLAALKRALADEGIDNLEKLYKKFGDDILGAVTFSKEGNATIRIFKGADLSVLVHEDAHVLRRMLPGDDMATLEKAYRVRNGSWTRSAEERFAKDVERYFAGGKAPSPELQGVFDRVRYLLREVWNVFRNDSSLKLDPSVRKTLDSWFSVPPRGDLEAALSRRGVDVSAGSGKAKEAASRKYLHGFDRTLKDPRKRVFVTRHDTDKLNKKTWTVITTRDGRAGALVKPADPEQVKVLPNGQKTREISGLYGGGGRSPEVIRRAVAEGGNYLEAYDAGLVRYYKSLGFKELSRDAFDPQYLSPADKAVFDSLDLAPDYVTLYLDDAAKTKLLGRKRIESYAEVLSRVGEAGVGVHGGRRGVVTGGPRPASEAASVAARLASRLETHVAKGRVSEDVATHVRRALAEPENRELAKQVDDLLASRQKEEQTLGARLARAVADEEKAVKAWQNAVHKSSNIPATVTRERVRKTLASIPEGHKELRKAHARSGALAFPPQVEDMFTNMIDYVSRADNVSVQKIEAAVDAFHRFFRSWAIATPGFVWRNTYGIMWQNFVLAGASPKAAVKAWRVLLGDFSTRARQLGDEGTNLGPITKLARAVGKSDKGDDLLRLASEEGVIDKNFFESIRSLKDATNRPGFNRVFKVDLNPFSSDNVFIRTIYKGQQAAENWGRLTVFIDALEKGMTKGEAADRAIFFHFAYDELTPLERRVGKKLFGFPTWTKNNIPLQAEAFMSSPRRFIALDKIRRGRERETGTSAAMQRAGERTRMLFGFPLVGNFFLTPDLPPFDLNVLPGSLEEWGRFGVIREFGTPTAKAVVGLLSGKGPLQEGDVRDAKVAPAWAEWPAVKQVLSGLGRTFDDPATGKTFIDGPTKFLLEDFWPLLGRIDKLAPNDKENQKEVVERVFSYFWGIGLDKVVEEEQARETNRRAANIERKHGKGRARERLFEKNR